MNRKRDEALGFQDDAASDVTNNSHSVGGYSAAESAAKRMRKMLKSNDASGSEAPSLIDSELLADEKSQSSHLTSNIDSVYSFYKKAGTATASQMSIDVPENTGSEIEASKKPSSAKKGVDLQQLMMEINASVFTPAEQQAAMRKGMMILSKGAHHQVHALDDEEDEEK